MGFWVKLKTENPLWFLRVSLWNSIRGEGFTTKFHEESAKRHKEENHIISLAISFQ